MSASPSQELLAVASKPPPATPTGPKYDDPVTVALLRLPFTTDERRQELAAKWESAKPALLISNALEWYARHDRDILLFGRIGIATLPLILTTYGIPIPLLVSGVAVSLSIFEWLDRVRSEKERQRTKAEAMNEYWRSEVEPGINAQKRRLWKDIELSGGPDCPRDTESDPQ